MQIGSGAEVEILIERHEKSLSALAWSQTGSESGLAIFWVISCGDFYFNASTAQIR